jgi:hypothetical protein
LHRLTITRLTILGRCLPVSWLSILWRISCLHRLTKTRLTVLGLHRLMLGLHRLLVSRLSVLWRISCLHRLTKTRLTVLGLHRLLLVSMLHRLSISWLTNWLYGHYWLRSGLFCSTIWFPNTFYMNSTCLHAVILNSEPIIDPLVYAKC